MRNPGGCCGKGGEETGSDRGFDRCSRRWAAVPGTKRLVFSVGRRARVSWSPCAAHPSCRVLDRRPVLRHLDRVALSRAGAGLPFTNGAEASDFDPELAAPKAIVERGGLRKPGPETNARRKLPRDRRFADPCGSLRLDAGVKAEGLEPSTYGLKVPKEPLAVPRLPCDSLRIRRFRIRPSNGRGLFGRLQHDTLHDTLPR